MRRFNQSAIGVQNGSQIIFSGFSEHDPMWSGRGERETKARVDFDGPFLGAPIVHVSITMLDMQRGANHRVDLSAENVTAEGFDLVFRTWGDTQVGRVRADWLAIGPARHEDDWDV
ncbi:MAG: H-type lectin domain-containing protein [Paracoccus sp. (in: a-proteobacteria)]|nr:H-type lectin domain-containing protein [Paracoccus sp. (in: a-proteobacteria)]